MGPLASCQNEDEQIGYYIEAALPIHVCHLARAAGSVAAIIADPALMGCLESNDYLACGTTVRALYPLNVSLDPFGRNEDYSRRLLAGIARALADPEMPSHTQPGPPPPVRLVESTRASIMLEWDYPTVNGGSTVIGFELWIVNKGSIFDNIFESNNGSFG